MVVGWARWRHHRACDPLSLTRCWRSPAIWGAITKAGAVQAQSRPRARPTGPHKSDRPRPSKPLLGPRSRTLRGPPLGRGHRGTRGAWGRQNRGHRRCCCTEKMTQSVRGIRDRGDHTTPSHSGICFGPQKVRSEEPCSHGRQVGCAALTISNSNYQPCMCAHSTNKLCRRCARL
jgi:hypothetical protein